VPLSPFPGLLQTLEMFCHYPFPANNSETIHNAEFGNVMTLSQFPGLVQNLEMFCHSLHFQKIILKLSTMQSLEML
jgi:hypothetical protein